MLLNSASWEAIEPEAEHTHTQQDAEMSDGEPQLRFRTLRAHAGVLQNYRSSIRFIDYHNVPFEVQWVGRRSLRLLTVL